MQQSNLNKFSVLSHVAEKWWDPILSLWVTRQKINFGMVGFARKFWVYNGGQIRARTQE
jgi:hypothetical protein